MAFLLRDNEGNVTDKIGGSTFGPSSSGDVTIDTPKSDLQQWIDYQTARDELQINAAKQQWEAQAKADQIAMQFSADEAQKLRDWQEQMSNTAYQRSVADMKKAGINPLLAVSNGGASTPSGGSGSGVSSARHAANISNENVAQAFGTLVAELTQSAMNTAYSANSSKWSSAVNSVGNMIGNLLPNISMVGSFGKQ